jgi:tetratricopeptide (TPR) repeat protein
MTAMVRVHKILFCGSAAVMCSACLFIGSARAQTLSASAVERYSEEAQRALADGRYAEAETALEELRKLQPNVAEVHANLGVVYFQEKKYVEAVQALRQALKLKPNLPKTDSLLAISLSELGRYSEALPGLDRGFHRSTDPATKRMCGLQLLRTYTGLQRDKKAVEVALELNRLYPEDPEVLYHTGRIFGNFAFLSMRKLAEVGPGSVWRHQALAEASESQKDFDTAIGEYRQVLAIDPRRPGIHYRLGRTLLARSRETTSSENAAAALKEFELELEIDPRNANAAYEIGESHRYAGEFQEAQKYFEQALTSYPDFEEAQLGLASVLMSRQMPSAALPHLRTAIQLNSGNEVAWYRLSQVERTLGNTAEAQQAFSRFQELRKTKSAQQEAGKQLASPTEVTKQQVDANSPP